MPTSHVHPERDRASCGCEIPSICVHKAGAKASACGHFTNWTHMTWCDRCALEKGVCFICGKPIDHTNGPVS